MPTNKEVQHETMPVDKSEVKFWLNEIGASEKYQKDEFTTRIGYSILVKYFEGIQANHELSLEHMVILDELSPGIASIISQVIFQNPSVDIEANHPLAEKPIQVPLLYMLMNPDFQPYSLVDLMDGALKHLIKKVGLKQELQLALFDMLVAGFTVTEMNHESKPLMRPQMAMGEETLAQPPQQSNFQKWMGEAKDFIKDPAGLSDGSKSKDEVEEELAMKAKYERYGFKDSTYCERWDPRDILFDSRTRGIFKKSRFICKIIRMSMAEFNELYPDFKDQIPSDEKEDMEWSSYKSIDDRKGVKVYELQIKEEQGLRILVLAKGINDALDNYYLPFKTNDFTLKYQPLDRYGKLYAMPRMKKAKHSQDTKNKLGTLEMEHATRALRKIGYWEGGLTPQGKSAILSPDVYGLIAKNTPSQIFESMPELPASQDNQIMQQKLTDTINKQLGASELVKSGQSDNKLLGQDMLEQQAFDTKASQVQDAMRDLVQQLLDTGKDIILQLWEEEDYFKITGKNGAMGWYDPAMGPIADIGKGDYLLTIDMVSAQKPNPVKSKQEALELATWMTSPVVQQYLMLNGKRSNMTVIENAIKQFNQNPEAMIDDLEPLPVPGLDQGQPNALPNTIETPGQAPVPNTADEVINQGG